MNPFRFSLILLGTLGLFALGCDSEDDTADDTGEADTDTDTDADTDTDTDSDVDYMDVYWWSWALYTGVQGSAFADVEADGNVVPPLFEITLAEEEWTENWDDRYVCYLRYTAASTPGTSDPKAWFDWNLDLTPSEEFSTCDNLDPAMFGDDPWTAFSDMSWEYTIEGIVPDVLADIEEWSWDDWDAVEPAIYGADTFIDGTSIADSNDMDQMMFGYALAVDADMIVGEDLVNAVDVAAGADGYYQVFNMYIYGMGR
ncbi:MAG: hypothetical protein JXB39_05770 [Deltaproteobacteria bacterium]|nr:hypothetical protein [Deltaproteobacteria bacterium]